MDRFVVPGAIPLTTTPSSVPLPLTPGVLGWRVAEIMAWPCSLSTRWTRAISCVPPERNPPWRTSSTLITAGLYWSSIGTEYRSVTFLTTMPTVAVWPGLRFIVEGSKRMRGPVTCAPIGAAELGAGATDAVGGGCVAGVASGVTTGAVVPAGTTGGCACGFG